jgi:hypothetical protein
MRVHHHGLANLFEFLPVMRAPLRLDTHPVECAPAAPVCWRRCSHTVIIERFRKQRPLALRTGVPYKQPTASRGKAVLGMESSPARPLLRALARALTFVMRRRSMVAAFGNERPISRPAYSPGKLGMLIFIRAISGFGDSTWPRASCPSEASL